MRSKRGVLIFQHVLYALLLYLLYIIQTTPQLFQIMGVKPVWVVPFAIALAMYRGEFGGGVYGAVAGLLCDLGGFTLFGFNGLTVCICSIGAGLLVVHLMHRNVVGCMLIVFFTMMLRGSIGYFFAYGIWNYEGAWKVFAYQTVPTAVYTMLVTPLLYGLVRKLSGWFAERLG